MCRSISSLNFNADEPQLENLLGALPTLPLQSQPPQLSYTVALVISSYAEWLDRSIQAGHCIGFIPRQVGQGPGFITVVTVACHVSISYIFESATLVHFLSV